MLLSGRGMRTAKTLYNTLNMDLSLERRRLPIYPAREALIREIKKNTNCVVVGETGSGKTTQIPQVTSTRKPRVSGLNGFVLVVFILYTQYVYESGMTRKGSVAVTQPRRVAAVSIAKRVAEEKGVSLGDTVRVAHHSQLRPLS